MKFNHRIFYFCYFIFLCLLVGCTSDNEVEGVRVYFTEDKDIISKTSENIDLPKPSHVSSWSQSRLNAQNNLKHFKFSKQPRVFWENKASGSSRYVSSPIIFNNNLYVLNEKGELISVTLDGDKDWKISINPKPDEGEKNLGGGLSYNGKDIIVTTGFGEMLSISPKHRKINWRYKFSSPFNSGPTIFDNKIFAITTSGLAVAVSYDGQLAWTKKGPALNTLLAISASPAATKDLLLLPFTGGKLLSVDPKTGLEKWTESIDAQRLGYARSVFGEISGNPVIKEERIYFGSLSGQIKALDIDGRLVWSRSIGINGTPIILDNSVFFISDLGSLVRLNNENGDIIWSKKIESKKKVKSYFGPILAGSNLWIAGSDKKFRGFDPTTGELNASIDLRDRPSAPPVYSEERIFIVTTMGDIIALQ